MKNLNIFKKKINLILLFGSIIGYFFTNGLFLYYSSVNSIVDLDPVKNDLNNNTNLHSSSFSVNYPEWSYIFPTDYFPDVVISGNGEYVVAISQYHKSIHLFNRSTGEQLWVWSSEYLINAVDISFNGDYIVLARGINLIHEQDNVFCFSKLSNISLWSYSCRVGPNVIKIAAEGNYFVAGSSDDNIYIFGTTGGYQTSEDLGSDVTSVAISADGRYIIAGVQNYRIYVYDRLTEWMLWSRPNSGYSVDISGDGNYLISAGNSENKIFYFALLNSTPIWNFTFLNRAHNIAISYDGKTLIVGTDSPDEKIYLFNSSHTESISLLKTFQCIGEISAVAISYNGEYFTAGTQKGYLYYFRNTDNSPLWISTIENYNNNADTRVDISANGDYVMWGQLIDRSIKCFYGHKHIPIPPILEINTTNPNFDGNLFLNWTESPHTDKYVIYKYNTSITALNSSIEIFADDILNLNTSITGLNAGKYFFVVVAYNDTGYGVSNCEYVEVVFPPNATDLYPILPNPDYDGIIDLNWTNMFGATSYYIYRDVANITTIDGINPIAITSVNNYQDVIFNNGTYYYVIVAGNIAGNSTISNCESVEITLPPNAPELNIILPNPDLDGIIDLNWTNVIDATYYYVYRDIYNITSIDGLIPIASTPVNNYQDNISIHGTYYYVIVAGNIAGNSTISNCESVEIILPPNAPELNIILPNPDHDGIIDLIWTNVIDATIYYIYRDMSIITSIVGMMPLATTSENNYQDTLSIDGMYFYVIIAGNIAGNSSISNCEFIIIDRNIGGNGISISGYNLILLIGFICIISLFLAIKKRSK